MVRDRVAALAHARSSLADAGEVVVVDFSNFAGWPLAVARAFRAYPRAFHVEPLTLPRWRALRGCRSGRHTIT
jgi:hypothetical protein